MEIDKPWIQNHLDQPVKGTKRSPMKKLAPAIELANGAVISVQASDSHYCTPKRNHGPYVSVEVSECGLSVHALKMLQESAIVPASGVTLFPRSKRPDPYGWVDINLIVAVINYEGGINNGDQAGLDALYGDKS